jgi:hypothetical protein
MTTLQDAKLATLQTQLAATGHVNDLEHGWLVALGATPASLVDMWWEVFDAAAIPAGQFNDRAVAYITQEVGAPPSADYNAAWQHYWENATLGPPLLLPPALANLQHWFDFTDAATVFSDVAGTIPAFFNSDIRNVTNKGTDGQPMIDAGTVPIYNTGAVNGLNVAGQAGSNFNSLGTTMLNGGNAAGMSFGIVCRRILTAVGTLAPFSWDGGSDFNLQGVTVPAIGWRHRFTTGGGFINSNRLVTANEWIWYYGTIDAVGNYVAQVSGTAQVSGVTGYTPVGINQALNLAGHTGQDAENKLWDRALTPAELVQLIAYYDAKYGVMPF